MKKLLIFTLVMLISVSALFSCKIFQTGNGEGEGNGDGTGEGTTSDNLIYDPGVQLQIVMNGSELAAEGALTVYGKLNNILPLIPSVVDDSAAAAAHEIVIGPSEREISQVAYRRLDRIQRDSEDDIGYVIYSDGSSIAIAYDEDERGVTLDEAIRYLTDEIIKDRTTLRAAKGVLHKDAFDINDYYSEQDLLYIDAQWTELYNHLVTLVGASYAQEFVDAMKDHYAIYSSDVFTWLANLYDPETGAFYYSNSARDNFGFAPDIESTAQALAFLENVGTCNQYYDGSVNGSMPDWMIEDIVSYVKTYQDPDGYFYHPQWERDSVTTNRRARDLVWFTNLLKQFGEKPYYDTATGGMKGEGAPASPTSLTGKLGKSSVIAVSSVVATAATPEYLQNQEAFVAWLDTLNLNGNSYYFCNLMSTLHGTFNARDKELGLTGKPNSFVNTLLDYLDAHQNPATGCWDLKQPGDDGYSDYEGVNGLLKIGNMYTGAGRLLPNIENAFQSCVKAINSSEPIGGITDLYNAFWAISNLYTNVTKCGGDPAMSEKYQQMLLKNAPSIIRATTAKVIPFKKADGSFSYGRDYSSYTSQGMVVAVQYSAEGDVNGNGIAINGITSQMHAAFRLSSYKVDMFGDNDRRRFFEIINELGPVIKDAGLDIREPVTFDDEVLGEKPTEADSTFNSEGSFTVITDPRNVTGGGKVAEIASLEGGGDSVRINVTGNISSATCNVFQGDFCVVSGNDAHSIRIQCGGYMLTLVVRKDGSVELWENSSTFSNLTVRNQLYTGLKVGEWFTIKTEYYYGDADTVRIKVYLNDKLIAISDNYADENGYKIKDRESEPKTQYNYATVGVHTSSAATLLIDNLWAYKTTDRFKAESDPDADPLLNLEYPGDPEKLYGFEELETGKNYPDGFTVTENGGTVDVVSLGDGKALALTQSAKGDPFSIITDTTVRGEKANATAFEADVTVNSENIGQVLSVLFEQNNASPIVCAGYALSVIDINGTKYVTVAAAPAGQVGASLGGVMIPVGETFKLRIEYYTSLWTAIIYVNGQPVAVSDDVYSGARHYKAYTVRLEGGSGTDSSLTLDNIKTERVAGTFSAMTSPSGGQQVHDFESGFGSVLHEGTVTVANAGGDKAARIGTKDDAFITIPVNRRSVLVSLYTFKASVNFSMVSAKGNMFHIELTDSEGNVILAYEINSVSRKPRVYETTAYGTHEYSFLELPTGGEVELKIEYYAVEGAAIFYIDGKIVAVSNLQYSPENATLSAESLTIKSTGTNNVLYLDDITLDASYKTYTKPEFESDESNAEDKAELITFEPSTTGNLPAAITATLKTSGADARIEGAFKNGAFGKVLSFSSTTGSGDNIVLGVTKGAEDATGVMFEGEIYIDSAMVTTLFQISMTGELGNGYMINVNRTSDGCINLVETSHTNDGGKIQRTICQNLIKVNEWFKLKIEYFYGDRDDVRIRVYVDDELYYTSNNFFNSHKDYAEPPAVIDSWRISALNATIATVKLDNLRLEEITEPAPDKVGRPANAEDGLEVIGFEHSNSNLLPAVISTELRSGGGKISVEELAIYNATSKVLVFETGKGANDRLIIGLTKDLENETQVTFEADMYISTDHPGVLYQIFLSNDQDGVVENAYMVQLTVNSDGTITFEERAGTNTSINQRTVAASKVSTDGWFRLKIEFYRGDKNTVRSKFYLNDTLCYINNNFFGSNVAANEPLCDINCVRISSLSSAIGTMMLDNVSLIDGTGTCTEYPTHYVPTEEPEGTGKYAKDEATLTFDDETNKYLTVTGSTTKTYEVANDNTTGYAFVFETDIRLNSFSDSLAKEWLFYITLRYNSGSEESPELTNVTDQYSRVSIAVNGGKAYLMSTTPDYKWDETTGAPADNLAELTLKKWYNLRIEVHQTANEDGTYTRTRYVYLDGKEVAGGEGTVIDALLTPYHSVAVTTRKSASYDVDNVFVGAIGEQSLPPEKEPEPEPEGYYGKGAYASDEATLTYDSQTSGYLSYNAQGNQTFPVANGNTTANKYVYETDIRINSFAETLENYWLMYWTVQGINSDGTVSNVTTESSRLSVHVNAGRAWLIGSHSASFDETTGEPKSSFAELNTGEWYNIRIEVSWVRDESGTYSRIIAVYLNGEEMVNATEKDSVEIGSPYSGVMLSTRTTVSYDVDNVFVGGIGEADSSRKDNHGNGDYASDEATLTYDSEEGGYLSYNAKGTQSFTVANGNTTGTQYVYETDFRINSFDETLANYWLVYWTMYYDKDGTATNCTTQSSRVSLFANAGRVFLVGGTSAKFDADTGAPTSHYGEIELGVWYNLRIVVTQTPDASGTYTRKIAVYLNGAEKKNATEKSGQALNAPFASVAMTTRTTVGYDVDNVFVGGID